MRKIANFLKGGMVGMLLGGIFALLMAPSSGDELRSTAQSRFENYLKDIRRAAAERRAELEAELEALKRGEG